MPSPLTCDQVSTPVPRDIEISQSLEGSLSHIAKVGEACGILESELEPYGRFKAKVGRQDNSSLLSPCILARVHGNIPRRLRAATSTRRRARERKPSKEQEPCGIHLSDKLSLVDDFTSQINSVE